MWRVASEAYAYLAGHPCLTDTVLHRPNGKTDNGRQIINKQHAAAEINQLTSQHTHKNSTNRSSLCNPYNIQLLIDRGWSDHFNENDPPPMAWLIIILTTL